MTVHSCKPVVTKPSSTQIQCHTGLPLLLNAANTTFAKINGTKIILHVRSSTFRTAKFKGVTVFWLITFLQFYLDLRSVYMYKTNKKSYLPSQT